MSAASMRATVSRMPPGATGTTSATGRFGYGCASAIVANNASATEMKILRMISKV